MQKFHYIALLLNQPMFALSSLIYGAINIINTLTMSCLGSPVTFGACSSLKC